MAGRASQSQPPLSQELDARFSVFLNPIRDLTKNWEVDIAKYLEEYLEELSEVRLSLDGGNTSMNFAEAAMLIQGSVTIYSKKVDFLWQMVLKTLDLLSSRRALDAGGDAGAVVAGGGGGRKSRIEIALNFSCVDNIQISRNIELQEDEDGDSRQKSVKFLPSTPLNLIEKEVEKSQNRISLIVRNNDVLGAKDDYRLSRSYLTPSGMLHLEVPGEILEGALSSGSQVQEVGGTANIPEQVDHPPSEEDQAPEDEPMPPLEDQPPSEDDPPPDDHSPCEDEPLPPPQDHLPSQEDHPPPTEDPESQCNNNNNNNNNNNESPIDITKQRYGLRKRNKDNKETVATLKLTDKLKPFDPNADCPPKRPPRAGRLRVPTPCPCHRSSQSKKEKNAKNKNLASKNLIPLEEFLTSKLQDVINKKLKRDKSKKVPSDIVQIAAEEEEKRVNEAKVKAVKQLSEKGVCEEEALQAVEEAGQEARVSPQFEEDDDPLGDDAPVDLDMDNPGFVLPEAHLEKQLPESVVAARLNDSVASEEPGSEYEALVLKWVADYVNSAQESIKSTELERRVNHWRKTVTPKLQAEEARTEFDIHSYGSLVLGHFPNDGRKQTIPFKQLMGGTQDPREVARFFLSCLMLANSHNIELSNTDPDEMAMDCLELTLMSRVRHHEELQEYAAPSQANTTRSSGMDMKHLGSTRPPGVCADITQTTNLQNAVNINSKKGSSKKRALPR